MASFSLVIVGECSGVGRDWRCFRNSAVALVANVGVVEVVLSFWGFGEVRGRRFF